MSYFSLVYIKCILKKGKLIIIICVIHTLHGVKGEKWREIMKSWGAAAHKYLCTKKSINNKETDMDLGLHLASKINLA